eukprot:TRINITY_DN9269_c0_g1_i1.p1 TRINITY_DN9269_c0_g1~~TRINITY_DN9269_c0_g1_i1.p1  ORF type:complete len:213 (-),score=26.64 TRINITY_DN9269_c0_g1_i1:87-725(-)
MTLGAPESSIAVGRTIEKRDESVPCTVALALAAAAVTTTSPGNAFFRCVHSAPLGKQNPPVAARFRGVWTAIDDLLRLAANTSKGEDALVRTVRSSPLQLAVLALYLQSGEDGYFCPPLASASVAVLAVQSANMIRGYCTVVDDEEGPILGTIYVHPHSRRQGLAGVLIRHFYSELGGRMVDLPNKKMLGACRRALSQEQFESMSFIAPWDE